VVAVVVNLLALVDDLVSSTTVSHPLAVLLVLLARTLRPVPVVSVPRMAVLAVPVVRLEILVQLARLVLAPVVWLVVLLARRSLAVRTSSGMSPGHASGLWIALVMFLIFQPASSSSTA
jgi:hypothetical protein